MHTEDLALFSVPPMNVSEDDIQWINYEPYFGKDGKGSIHFNISGTGNCYTNLGKSNLFVWISLRKLNGEPFIQEQNEHAVAIKSAVPIDNVLHSLWSQCDISFNSQMVSTSSNYYMYKAYIKTLLNFNTMACDKQMELIGYTGDSGYMSQTDPMGIPISTGLKECYKWWKKISTKYSGTEQKMDDDDEIYRTTVG